VTLDHIRRMAVCLPFVDAKAGLKETQELIVALAEVYEAAANLLRIEPKATVDRQIALAEVLARRVARVEALPP
jgi:hypothetical protein